MTAWTGGRLNDRVTCRLCPNPGPMTLDGTNTWVVSAPGSYEAVVIDPGPLDEGHLQRVLADVAERGARVRLVLVTHGHLDHAESLDRFAELTRAPVRGSCAGAEAISPGEVFDVAGVRISTVPTPGHTMDSLCFLLEGDQILFTGDTILGRGTTVVAHPDGQLAAYLESLQVLADLAARGAVTTLAPGHGPVVRHAAATIEEYQAHRQERLEQVRAACRGSEELPRAELADAVVASVYAEVPPTVWPAARQSVLAQLDYLQLGR